MVQFFTGNTFMVYLFIDICAEQKSPQNCTTQIWKTCSQSPKSGTHDSVVVIKKDKVTRDMPTINTLPLAATCGKNGCRRGINPEVAIIAPILRKFFPHHAPSRLISLSIPLINLI